jgi:hypothetical protein
MRGIATETVTYPSELSQQLCAPWSERPAVAGVRLVRLLASIVRPLASA